MKREKIERVERVRISMTLPEDLRDYVKMQANENGFNVTTMIQVMIMSYKQQSEALNMSKLVIDNVGLEKN